MKLYLKQFILVMASLWMPAYLMAQHEMEERRGRIENLTDFRMLPTSRQHRVGSIATAPLRCVGSPKVPVILVQFADLSFTSAENDSLVKVAYQDFYNAGEGVSPCGSFCSVKEYFRSQSDGQFSPEFDVIGPVTLSKGFAYYGEDQGSRKDIHISEFWREACKLAMQNEVDWSQYDNDGNGVVDFVFFIYAGHGQNQKGIESGAIWPKESVSLYVVEDEDEGFSVSFGSYGCTNELYKGSMDGIGACIHELCHGLGLPDFYDTNYSAYGLDYWDVMDSGCYKIQGFMPIGLSAYERDFLGWKKLVELEPDSAYSLTIEPLEKEGVGYKVVNKANANEYFILENRQNIGADGYIGWITRTQYVQYGANHGLMITHVDFSQSAWNGNTVNTNASHQRITLVPADGELVSALVRVDSVWAMSTHGDLYPGDNQVKEMASYAVYTGSSLGQIINNIVEEENGTVTVDINGGKKPDDDPEDPEGLYEPDIPELR